MTSAQRKRIVNQHGRQFEELDAIKMHVAMQDTTRNDYTVISSDGWPLCGMVGRRGSTGIETWTALKWKEAP